MLKIAFSQTLISKIPELSHKTPTGEWAGTAPLYTLPLDFTPLATLGHPNFSKQIAPGTSTNDAHYRLATFKSSLNSPTFLHFSRNLSQSLLIFAKPPAVYRQTYMYS